jgi:membrane protein YdbS with pleckstrin-like domain
MASLREPAQRVSPRARAMWRVAAVVQGAVLLLAAALGGWLWHWWPLPWWAFGALLAVVAAYAVVMPAWRYQVHRWEVTDTAVYTQTGWWVRERRVAPMSRIQTVDLAEGPVARLFGLAAVTVTTASAAGALAIAGLERARARALVDELTLKADTAPGDAT